MIPQLQLQRLLFCPLKLRPYLGADEVTLVYNTSAIAAMRRRQNLAAHAVKRVLIVPRRPAVQDFVSHDFGEIPHRWVRASARTAKIYILFMLDYGLRRCER